MRTKAKLQIAQGRLKNAIETYTHLLAVLQVRNKNFRVGKQLLKVWCLVLDKYWASFYCMRNRENPC